MRLALAIALVASLTGCSSGSSSHSTSDARGATSRAARGFTACEPRTQGGKRIRLRVAGGVACAQARTLLRLGPSLAANLNPRHPYFLNGHPVLAHARFQCSLGRPLSEGRPVQPFACRDGAKRARYRFFPPRNASTLSPFRSCRRSRVDYLSRHSFVGCGYIDRFIKRDFYAFIGANGLRRAPEPGGAIRFSGSGFTCYVHQLKPLGTDAGWLIVCHHGNRRFSFEFG